MAESVNPASDDKAEPARTEIIDGAERLPSGLTARAEAALVRRAARNRWPITSAHMAKAVETMDAIQNDPKSTNRDKIGAARAIFEMVQADREEDRLDEGAGGPQTPPVNVGVNVNIPAQQKDGAQEDGDEDRDAKKVAGTVAAILAGLHGNRPAG